MFREVSVVGDKYPGYAFGLDRYAENARLSRLVIYRDGRDVVSSMLHAARTKWKDVPFTRNMDTAKKVAQRWVLGIEQMLKHEPSSHVVRYEELVTDPRAVMTGIGEWLGVDPDRFPFVSPHPASVGKYRDGLSIEELDAVDRLAGETLTRLGYR